MGQPKHPLYWIYSGLILLFHETHQTISSDEMAERASMLDLHPLRRDMRG